MPRKNHLADGDFTVTFGDGLHHLDWEKYSQFDDAPCYLVALSHKSLSAILALTNRFLYVPALWNVKAADPAWPEIREFVENEIEACLLMGCDVRDLIKTQRMLVAAITGQSVDLDADLPTGVVDFSGVGLSPKFEGDDGNIAEAVEALAGELANLRQTIEEQNAGDLEDDLANVWNSLSAIATVLGITVGAPPTPL